MLACPRCHSIYSTEIEFCGMDGDRLVELTQDPLIGLTIDRYRVLEQLGTGGMGNVYRATHQTLEHEYAIKVLFGEMAANKTLAERFRREAQAVSRMRHPNIVSVVDFGTTPSGLTFLTMELLRGRTLGDALLEEGTIPPRRVARIARQIADGLSEAHRLGFVHRDLKPGNVMLVDQIGDELVKVLDFGIVGFQDVPDQEKLTRPGFVLGTPTYMAPEQVYQSSVGAQADLYALGTIMYEMLTGQPPFVGDQMQQVIVRQLTEKPAPLPAAGGLEGLIEALLEKAPENRPASATEVIGEIDRLVDGMRTGRAASRRRAGGPSTRPESPRPALSRAQTPAASSTSIPKASTSSRSRPATGSGRTVPAPLMSAALASPISDFTPVAFERDLVNASKPGEPLAAPRSGKLPLIASLGGVAISALFGVMVLGSKMHRIIETPVGMAPSQAWPAAPSTPATPSVPKISTGVPEIELEPAADPPAPSARAARPDKRSASDAETSELLRKTEELGRTLQSAKLSPAKRSEVEQRYKALQGIVKERRLMAYDEAAAEIARINRILSAP